MGTQTAPLDLAERDLAAAQLDYIALTSRGSGADAWKDAVLQWHCEAIAKARAEGWIPGMGPLQDRIIGKVLKRFYRHRFAVMVRGLKAENLKLRRDLLDALRSVRFHQRGGTDEGEPERSTVWRPVE
jgi:hypothetical protein